MRTVDNNARARGQRVLLAAALGALVVLVPRTAQAQDVIHACYVPASGTIYRIKVTDDTETCKAAQHIEFHWNVEGPAGADGVSGYEVLSETVPLTSAGLGKVLPCPAGKRVLGGGFSILDTGPGGTPTSASRFRARWSAAGPSRSSRTVTRSRERR